MGGPLSAGEIVGGVSVNQPDTDPWRASFGAFFLCSEDGVTAELEGVRTSGAPRPLSVQAVLHARASGSARPPDRFASRLGSPPDWDEPYVEAPTRNRAASAYTEDVRGEVVDEPCPTDPVEEEYPELVLILEAGDAGADVKRFFVDYRVEDKAYTLQVDWELVMCGTQVSRHCK